MLGFFLWYGISYQKVTPDKICYIFYLNEALLTKRSDHFDYFSKKQADESEKTKSSYSSVSRVIEEPKESTSLFDRFFPRNRIFFKTNFFYFKSTVFSFSRSFILYYKDLQKQGDFRNSLVLIDSLNFDSWLNESLVRHHTRPSLLF